MQQHPQFRSDLVAQAVADGGQRFVDVTDPDSGSTFRFYEVEYAVACAMDGKRDHDGLVAWSQAELGLHPSTDEIAVVVSTLDELGYLAAKQAGDDFALGNAGKSPLSEPRPDVSAPDVALGRAGKEAAAAPAPAPAAEPAEVSVDLSQHISAPPPEKKAAPPAAPEAKPPQTPAAPSAAEVSTEVIEESAAADDTGAAPISIPADTPKMAPPSHEPEPVLEPAAPEAGGGGAMTAVLILLLLGVLGVGGYWVYTNFIQVPEAAPTSQAISPASPQA